MGKLSDYTDDIAHLYFVKGASYQEIGTRYGKSREAVRQFLNKHFPDRMSGREFRQKFREEHRARNEAEEHAARLAQAPECVICGTVVLRKTGGRGNRRTCSPEHSQLWAKARFLLDEDLRERQRTSMARSILKYRDFHPKSQVTWAEKVLAGDPVNPRKDYTRRDSDARRAYEEVLRIRAS